MTEIIIHHYPASPVSEKIRAGLGIKKLAWRSVLAASAAFEQSRPWLGIYDTIRR